MTDKDHSIVCGAQRAAPHESPYGPDPNLPTSWRTSANDGEADERHR